MSGPPHTSRRAPRGPSVLGLNTEFKGTMPQWWAFPCALPRPFDIFAAVIIRENLRNIGDSLQGLASEERVNSMGNDRDYGDSVSTKLTFFLVGAGIGAVLAKQARFTTPRVKRPANITKPLVNARLSCTIPRPRRRARLLRQRAAPRCVRPVRFRLRLRRERKPT